MNTQGIVIGLIDVPQEHTEDYNRWYDFDHLPEFAALPGMLLGRRYVALPEYKALRPPCPLPAPPLAEARRSCSKACTGRSSRCSTTS